jgi:hypothetical protein
LTNHRIDQKVDVHEIVLRASRPERGVFR